MRLFVTNRPNYCHKRFAESVGCKFYYARHFMPESIPLLSLPINGLLNSFSLEEAELFFAESIIDYYPVYYRKPKGRKIVLIAEDTLFKMEDMTGFKKNYIMKLLRDADGFLAISDLCKRILLKYVNKPAKTVYPFPHKEFFHVKADVGSKNILFIGRYDKTKGFLELVEAVKVLRRKDSEWQLYLIGGCSRSVKAEEGIFPLGLVPNMEPYFEKCAFLVHPARFDPCPATVFEAMNAGMIPVISRNIGQTEIFERYKLNELILHDTEPETIAEKLEALSEKNKRGLAAKVRNLSKEFREGKRLKLFKKKFESLVEAI